MGAWINKKANSIATCYLKKTGKLLDSGERPFDARMAFWILEKIARYGEILHNEADCYRKNCDDYVAFEFFLFHDVMRRSEPRLL